MFTYIFFTTVEYRAFSTPIMRPLSFISQNHHVWNHLNQVSDDACDMYDYGWACIVMSRCNHRCIKYSRTENALAVLSSISNGKTHDSSMS